MTSSDEKTEMDLQVEDASENVTSALGGLKDQAAQVSDEAKSTLTNMASDARGKISQIVDQQKLAGAEQLSGLAQAAHTAADDLADKNPHVARLVRDAASSVDRFAGDLRNRDLRDVLSSVTDVAREQPVAFFAGSVLAGFVLARFLKSDAVPEASSSSSQGGSRDWSASRRDLSV